MRVVSEKLKNTRAATLERSKRGLRKNLHFRCYKVLAILLYSNNPHVDRFGMGYVRVHLHKFVNYYGMSRTRFLDDLRILEKEGMVHHVTPVRGRVLFQLEKPLWNEKNQHSSAILALQKTSKTGPM